MLSRTCYHSNAIKEVLSQSGSLYTPGTFVPYNYRVINYIYLSYNLKLYINLPSIAIQNKCARCVQPRSQARYGPPSTLDRTEGSYHRISAPATSNREPMFGAVYSFLSFLTERKKVLDFSYIIGRIESRSEKGSPCLPFMVTETLGSQTTSSMPPRRRRRRSETFPAFT